MAHRARVHSCAIFIIGAMTAYRGRHTIFGGDQQFSVKPGDDRRMYTIVPGYKVPAS